MTTKEGWLGTKVPGELEIILKLLFCIILFLYIFSCFYIISKWRFR